MNREEMKGFLYQEYEPTPDNPCEIKGLNLLEVNDIQYTSNIPPNMKIGLTQEQYCEYLQLQQENHQLKDRIEKAIEYTQEDLDEQDFEHCGEVYVEYEWFTKLLKILKGEENENS